jgi:hypothetical protein
MQCQLLSIYSRVLAPIWQPYRICMAWVGRGGSMSAWLRCLSANRKLPALQLEFADLQLRTLQDDPELARLLGVGRAAVGERCSLHCLQFWLGRQSPSLGAEQAATQFSPELSKCISKRSCM